MAKAKLPEVKIIDAESSPVWRAKKSRGYFFLKENHIERGILVLGAEMEVGAYWDKEEGGDGIYAVLMAVPTMGELNRLIWHYEGSAVRIFDGKKDFSVGEATDDLGSITNALLRKIADYTDKQQRDTKLQEEEEKSQEGLKDKEGGDSGKKTLLM